MALALGHRFGQIIGELLQDALAPLLGTFAHEHGLYLDRQGRRQARAGRKVTWTDLYGNAHDLDYVLERAGSDEHRGDPVAFIEIAWRRYTKHSRNKAQEVQGAILPLMATYRGAAPFIGVVLAGVFTEGAIRQLRSQGFAILYLPYARIIEAFATVGLDASFDESTSEEAFQSKLAIWKSLDVIDKARVPAHLLASCAEAVDQFMGELRQAVTRSIKLVIVLPLHGATIACSSIAEAIDHVGRYDEQGVMYPLLRYEVRIEYSNGDRIEAQFAEKKATIEFLRTFVSAS